MNLLITMKLSDVSVRNHVAPIARLEDVGHIDLVRDAPGPAINKVRYVYPHRRWQSVAPLLVPIKLFQLIRTSIREKPSLIHAYLLFPHGYLAFLAGKLTRRKTGISLIAGPVETFAFGGSPIGTYSYCRPLPAPNAKSRCILRVLKKFDVITVTGTYTRDFLVRNGIDPGKIFILPHVVDERFRPLPVKKDYDVIFLGRLTQVKHVETIIRATARAKHALPQIRVVIVGDGPERRNLEALADSLGIKNSIDFVGYRTDTWEWYNRSRISVLASEREGIPYTIIESLRCGVPAVVSGCGDIRDLVTDSFNGRIIGDYRDDAAYADAIVELLTHPALLEEYAANCRKPAQNELPHSVEGAWEGILRACCGGSMGRRTMQTGDGR